MRILVCISNVPDTTTKVRFADGNTRLDTAGIQWVINPWDELSLTRALELKEEGGSGVEEVVVAHVGPPTSDPTIRKALAIGADSAIRVNTGASDAFQVAAQLSAILKEQSFDLVLCGIESSDYNGSNVGGMLAEFAGWPSVSAISGLAVAGGEVSVTREIDGGREWLRVPTPFVGIVQKGIAKEPRIASMRGIMQARTKPILVLEPDDTAPLTRVLDFEPPRPRAACKFVDASDPAELIRLLQNEAKVI
jgi:electron transfer flavoprotein beta subunit